MKFKEVEFQGKLYLLIGDDVDTLGAAIATKEDYENGVMGRAHLYPDGRILRRNEQIGNREDLTFTGREIEAEPSEAILEVLLKTILGSLGQ